MGIVQGWLQMPLDVEVFERLWESTVLWLRTRADFKLTESESESESESCLSLSLTHLYCELARVGQVIHEHVPKPIHV
jgi:hypothetical protein